MVDANFLPTLMGEEPNLFGGMSFVLGNHDHCVGIAFRRGV